MATWKCIQNCGACCHLDPSDRPDLDSYLDDAELAQYLSLIGPDGWCINYDPLERICNIYPERPRFCRATPDVFADMFEIEPTEFNDFAIECCQEQIAGVYGPLSLESHRYQAETGAL
jgi:uncharacterized protein